MNNITNKLDNRNSTQSFSTQNEKKNDFRTKKEEKSMNRFILNLKDLSPKEREDVLAFLEELDKEWAYLDKEDTSKNASAYELYIEQDPRVGVFNKTLYEDLYNFCIKAIRKRLVMLLDLESLITELVELAKYTYGFNENPTKFQMQALESARNKLFSKLKDSQVREFIKTNNDYTVFGEDESTRDMYISTYQKVLRILTNAKFGEDLEFYRDVIHNELDLLENRIIDNNSELEYTEYVECELDKTEDMCIAY